MLFPGRRATGGDDGVAHLLVVPRAAAVDADAGSAAEHAAHGAAAEHAAHGASNARTQHSASVSTSSGDDDAVGEKEPNCKRLLLAGDEVTDDEGADDHESMDNVCELLAGGGGASTDNKPSVSKITMSSFLVSRSEI